MSQRNLTIDAMKGLGICLVILGHVVSYGSSLSRLIFTFHMPLFFFLSGWLSTDKEKYSGKELGKYIAKYYVLYFVLTFLGVLRFYILKFPPWKEEAYRIFVHAHSTLNGPTWFLISLPLSVICFVVLYSLSKKSKYPDILLVFSLAILLCVAFAIQKLPFNYRRLLCPLNLTTLPLATFYVGCGWICRKKQGYLEKIKAGSKSLAIVGCFCLIPIIAAHSSWIGMMNLSVAEVGKILNVPASFFGVICTWLFCSSQKENMLKKVLGQIGRRSLAFFTMDFISLNFIAAILQIALPVLKGYLPTMKIPLRVSFLLWGIQMIVLWSTSSYVMKFAGYLQNRTR